MKICAEATERSAYVTWWKSVLRKQKEVLTWRDKSLYWGNRKKCLRDVIKECTEATERSAMDLHSPPSARAVFPLVCTNQHKTFVGGESFHYWCSCESIGVMTGGLGWGKYGSTLEGVDRRYFCPWFLYRQQEKKKQELVRENRWIWRKEAKDVWKDVQECP